VEKYGKNDSLYPKNPKLRAKINQLIYFDISTLFSRFYEYFSPAFFGQPLDDQKLESLKEAVGFLNIFMTDQKFAVAYKLTIADLILLSTVSTIEAFDFDFSPFPHVSNWLENMKQCAPGYDINQEGIEIFKSFFKK
jgi:glutathione S-transferase